MTSSDKSHFLEYFINIYINDWSFKNKTDIYPGFVLR